MAIHWQSEILLPAGNRYGCAEKEKTKVAEQGLFIFVLFQMIIWYSLKIGLP
jgi:hypothetical protein